MSGASNPITLKSISSEFVWTWSLMYKILIDDVDFVMMEIGRWWVVYIYRGVWIEEETVEVSGKKEKRVLGGSLFPQRSRTWRNLLRIIYGVDTCDAKFEQQYQKIKVKYIQREMFLLFFFYRHLYHIKLEIDTTLNLLFSNFV